jgi:uncharacterized repeat protein (TIGR03803 family)
MRSKKWFIALVHALLVSAITLVMVPGASAKPKFKVLAQVPGGLWTGLTLDAQGNLYGVTSGGGVNNLGSVFELTPDANGKWTATTLHSFNGTDGSSPNGNLILDAAGDLYGTAPDGGAYDRGTVFELSHGSGGWVFTVIYSFCPQYNCPDGSTPIDGLAVDRAGRLFGTTSSGGTGSSGGVAYELTPASGGWDESVIYEFGSRPYDSTSSTAPMTFNKTGRLYDTSYSGGKHHLGTVFRLAQNSGVWRERILYSFCKDGGELCTDGAGPQGGVVFDSTGSLYGATNGGGPYGAGTIFELAPSRKGGWKRTMLYDFADQGNGVAPVSVVRGANGALYGTAALGGNNRCNGGCGVVFKLAPKAHGKWEYTVLHKFDGSDGYLPDGGVIRDKRGNLYGVAFFSVFEITP